MTQRNPLNERYNNADEKKTGKSRKSSASVKPKAQRAATVRDPAPKSKKEKKEEARERERKAAEKATAGSVAFESTDGYKRLRRYWWVCLGGAIACTALSFFLQGNADLRAASMVTMILAYVLIIVAFWIDLGKIRKERKLYTAAMANNKSKEARKEQKKLRAERREQEKEAEEKFRAAKEEEARKAERKGGFLGRLRKGKGQDEDAQPGNDDKADGQR